MIEISVTDARDRLGDLVNQIVYSDERIVLTRHGRAAAALVSLDVLAAVEAAEDAADVAAAMEALGDSRPNVSHAQVVAELDQDDAHGRRSA